MRVLTIEDDHATAQAMELMMKSEGFNVYTTDLGEEGVDLAKIYEYDLITLDLGLPDMSGIEVLRQIRAAQVHTPILIISGNSTVETKVQTLSMGADDYLTKPFHKDELIARAHSIIRRAKGHSQATIDCGGLQVNLKSREAHAHGRLLHLTGKEFQMLALLALRKNETVRKDAVMNHLYGGMDEPEMKIVDVFICKLRKKLKDAGLGPIIQTTWGIGYRLTDPTLQPA